MDNQLPDFLIIPSAVIMDADLQPLDGFVFGLVYWYTKMKLEKCIASNAEIAKMLHASASGVSHALTRLARKGYVKIVLDEHNQRKEIIPLISFQSEVVDSLPSHKRATPLAQTSYIIRII